MKQSIDLVKNSGSGIIQDLLTENRYWTFWSNDWKIRVNVFWAGKTPFKEVTAAVKQTYFKHTDFGYERQVQLKKPDLSFT